MPLPPLLSSLFPPPHHRLTWRDALPLAVFLAVFGAGVALVSIRGWLVFSNPAAFWLSLAGLWVWWMNVAGTRGGLGRGQALAALMIRLVLSGTLVLLLAEPRAVRRSDVLSIVYALDLSDSMGAKVPDQALKFITDTASQKPQKDEAGLVVFGRDAAVELPPRTSFPFEAINSRVAKDGTDIEQGLSPRRRHAARGKPGPRRAHHRWQRDRRQRLGQLVDELKARGIAVDVLPIELRLREGSVARAARSAPSGQGRRDLRGDRAAQFARTGHGTLRLRENGKTIFEKRSHYAAGKNRFTLPLYLREPGYYEYAATIDRAAGRGRLGREQHRHRRPLPARRRPGAAPHRSAGRCRDMWEPLRGAQGQRSASCRCAWLYEFPREAAALLPYDLIIFANAPADAFDAAQLQALRDAVYQSRHRLPHARRPQNSFGPGGYHRTPVEEALPVDMDVKQEESAAQGRARHHPAHLRIRRGQHLGQAHRQGSDPRARRAG